MGQEGLPLSLSVIVGAAIVGVLIVIGMILLAILLP